MPSQDRKHGLRPVKYLSGVPYNGSVRRFKKEASVILAVGDPVVLTGTAETNTGIALVTRAQGTEGTPGTITGIVVGIDPIRSDLSKTYLAAADSGYILVADDPNLLHSVQADGTLAVTTIGEFCDLLVADADTTTGLSTTQLDASNAGTGDQMRLMEFAQGPAFTVSDAFPEMITMINETTYRGVGTPI